VLRDLSFVFPEDHSTAVVGPSGSGKTTLLAITGLLTRPTAGQVAIDGEVVATGGRRAAELRTDMFAWVFQTVNVLSNRGVADNAMLGLLARGLGQPEAEGAAVAALEVVGLAGMEGRRAASLSGGELQRLCIARAIAARPRFLLADEPTGQLDRAATEQVTHALIVGRPRGTTLIVVTHDPRVARQCDLVVALQDGQLSIGGEA
jgi:ABC-type lipoprotein export system ATPase subunit